jgi:hypothetical protein
MEPPGPSLTAAAEPKRSGRLTVCWFGLRCLCWVIYVIGATCRDGQCFAVEHRHTCNLHLHYGTQRNISSGELNSRMPVASGLNNVRILDLPSNTMSLNCNGQLELAPRHRDSNKLDHPYNLRTILKWVSRMSAPSLMDVSIWESQYSIFEIRHKL